MGWIAPCSPWACSNDLPNTKAKGPSVYLLSVRCVTNPARSSDESKRRRVLLYILVTCESSVSVNAVDALASAVAICRARSTAATPSFFSQGSEEWVEGMAAMGGLGWMVERYPVFDIQDSTMQNNVVDFEGFVLQATHVVRGGGGVSAYANRLT